MAKQSSVGLNFLKLTFNMFFLFVCLVLVFWDRVSLCSPSCLGTHSVVQAGLELKSTCLCLPNAGIKGVRHHARLNRGISKIVFKKWMAPAFKKRTNKTQPFRAIPLFSKWPSLNRSRNTKWTHIQENTTHLWVRIIGRSHPWEISDSGLTSQRC